MPKSDGCDTDDFLLRNEGPGDLNRVLISSRSVEDLSLLLFPSVSSSSPKISSSSSPELGGSWSVKSLELARRHNSLSTVSPDPAGSGLRDGLHWNH